jgi:hypothetical protein
LLKESSRVDITIDTRITAHATRPAMLLLAVRVVALASNCTSDSCAFTAGRFNGVQCAHTNVVGQSVHDDQFFGCLCIDELTFASGPRAKQSFCFPRKGFMTWDPTIFPPSACKPPASRCVGVDGAGSDAGLGAFAAERVLRFYALRWAQRPTATAHDVWMEFLENETSSGIAMAVVQPSGAACAVGFSGVLCGSCAAGYFDDVGQKCTACEANELDSLLSIASLFFIAVGVFLVGVFLVFSVLFLKAILNKLARISQAKKRAIDGDIDNEADEIEIRICPSGRRYIALAAVKHAGQLSLWSLLQLQLVATTVAAHTGETTGPVSLMFQGLKLVLLNFQGVSGCSAGLENGGGDTHWAQSSMYGATLAVLFLSALMCQKRWRLESCMRATAPPLFGALEDVEPSCAWKWKMFVTERATPVLRLVLFMYLNVIYAFVTMSALRSVHCIPLETNRPLGSGSGSGVDEVLYLASDNEVRCWTWGSANEASLFTQQALAVVTLVLYCVGYPIGSFLFLSCQFIIINKSEEEEEETRLALGGRGYGERGSERGGATGNRTSSDSTGSPPAKRTSTQGRNSLLADAAARTWNGLRVITGWEEMVAKRRSRKRTNSTESESGGDDDEAMPADLRDFFTKPRAESGAEEAQIVASQLASEVRCDSGASQRAPLWKGSVEGAPGALAPIVEGRSRTVTEDDSCDEEASHERTTSSLTGIAGVQLQPLRSPSASGDTAGRFGISDVGGSAPPKPPRPLDGGLIVPTLPRRESTSSPALVRSSLMHTQSDVSRASSFLPSLRNLGLLPGDSSANLAPHGRGRAQTAGQFFDISGLGATPEDSSGEVGGAEGASRIGGEEGGEVAATVPQQVTTTGAAVLSSAQKNRRAHRASLLLPIHQNLAKKATKAIAYRHFFDNDYRPQVSVSDEVAKCAACGCASAAPPPCLVLSLPRPTPLARAAELVLTPGPLYTLRTRCAVLLVPTVALPRAACPQRLADILERRPVQREHRGPPFCWHTVCPDILYRTPHVLSTDAARRELEVADESWHHSSVLRRGYVELRCDSAVL